MMDAVFSFLDTIRAAGLCPPESIEPGRFYRFPGFGKHQYNEAGWCLLFHDQQDGCFGDWSSGLSESWHAKQTRSCSREEHLDFARKVHAARAQAEAERRASQDKAANKARDIWSGSIPAPANHPYLMRKRIMSCEARWQAGNITTRGDVIPVSPDSFWGPLVLPVMSFTGQLTSLQFIESDGSKRLLAGGRKRGCYIPVAGDMASVTKVIICEGWATGCTLSKDDPDALVLAAIDAGNLERVALFSRCHWPSAELIIAGDDDRLTSGNPGATKARAAAISANALLALPQWPEDAPEHLTDFNDLALWLARADREG